MRLNPFLRGNQGNQSGMSNALKGSVKTSPMMAVGIGGFTALDWKSNMAQGDSFGVAGAKSLGTALLWHTNPALMWTYTAATAIPAAYQAGNQWYRKTSDAYRMQLSSQSNGVVGGMYQDTQRAQTMRQAAVQAIEGSKLNARSALGGEAKIYKDSWSRYD